jgi:DNA-binding NtrC family response regulator
MHRILVAHSEESMGILFAEELVEEGYDVTTCTDLPQLLHLMHKKQPSLIILNSKLGSYQSRDLLRLIRGSGNNLPVLLRVKKPVDPETEFGNVEYFQHNSSSLHGLKDKVSRLLGRPRMQQVRKVRPSVPLQAQSL